MSFDEEFETLSVCVDATSSCNWYAPMRKNLGTGTLAQPSNRQAISLSTNALTLQTINPSSSGVGGTDVNLRSNDSYGHGYAIVRGYVEAAISLPSAFGSHASFWMDTMPSSQGHGEIDFPETYGAADSVFTAHVRWWPTAASRFAEPVAVGDYWTPSPSPYAAWHSYGVLLTSSTICTYMDRKEIGCVMRIPEMSNAWFLQLSVFTDANRKDGYQPATMRVAYVRAWAD